MKSEPFFFLLIVDHFSLFNEFSLLKIFTLLFRSEFSFLKQFSLIIFLQVKDGHTLSMPNK